MRWRKQGRVYAPDGTLSWAKAYAFPPTPYELEAGRLRLFVAFCDAQTVGRVGYVDLDLDGGAQVVGVSQRPVLDVGSPGCFDDNGVLPTCVLHVGGELWMYYVGYQRGQHVPYFQFEGLAISEDGGENFVRKRRVPVIDRSDAELLNRTSAFVSHAEGRFRMWYVGGSEWTQVNGKPLPMYDIRYLESEDGENWGPEGTTCIPLALPEEHALGRPWIVQLPDRELMFYSSRTHSKDYRIGYAESRDGETWVRRDEDVGIGPSARGWDSDSLAYASVIQVGGGWHMFYNGNDRGKTGFGHAILEAW